MYKEVPQDCKTTEVTAAAMRCPFSTLELVKALTDRDGVNPSALLAAAVVTPHGNRIDGRPTPGGNRLRKRKEIWDWLVQSSMPSSHEMDISEVVPPAARAGDTELVSYLLRFDNRTAVRSQKLSAEVFLLHTGGRSRGSCTTRRDCGHDCLVVP